LLQLLIQNPAYLAIVGFYGLDFSLNCVMTAARALVCDLSPPDAQSSANANVAVMIALGNLTGYFLGVLDLKIFGATQLQVLCTIAAALLLASCCYTFSSTEPVRVSNQSGINKLCTQFFNLPLPIQQICNVQLFAWLAWFPFLFYATSWISDLTNSDDGHARGSLSLLLFSVVSLFTGILVPRTSSEPFLYKLWGVSLLVQGTLFLSAYFTSNTFFAILIIACAGVPWGVQVWAPFCLIGQYCMQAENEDTDEINTGAVQGLVSFCDTDDNEEPRNSRLVSNQERIESGAILGIHNVYIVMPQLISSLLGSFVFFLIGQNDGIGGFALVISIGGFFACIGGILAIGFGSKYQKPNTL
jgi:solute carrier family 45 protein 1/2/4